MFLALGPSTWRIEGVKQWIYRARNVSNLHLGGQKAPDRKYIVEKSRGSTKSIGTGIKERFLPNKITLLILLTHII